MRYLNLLGFVAGLLSSTFVFADAAYISVGAARAKKAVLAFPEIKSGTPLARALAKTASETVINDLTYMDLFKFISSSAFLENSVSAGIAPGSFKLTDWNTIGQSFSLKRRSR